MKPSDKIFREGGFDLSNTIDSSRLLIMWENKEIIINDNPAKFILGILKYLDEIYEAENSAREQLQKDIKPMD